MENMEIPQRERRLEQTAPTGIVRRLSAEQLLSHLLPPLASDQPHLSVKVVRKLRKCQ